MIMRMPLWLAGVAALLVPECAQCEPYFAFNAVDFLVPADELDAAAGDVIEKLVRGPAVALAKTKDAINATTLTELEAALEREHAGQAALLRGTDYREGIKAFQQRRAANFTDS